MNLIKRHKNTIILAAFLGTLSTSAAAEQIIKLQPSSADMTPVLRAALESVTDDEIKIILEKGTYKFLPDYAVSRYSTVTNHGNGMKNVIFPLDNFKSVEIEGNGADLIFHGQVAPFQLYNNKKISIKDLTIDWDIPFTFLSEVVAVNEKENWRDVKPASGSHHWKLVKDQIQFPLVDGFSFNELGSSMVWDKAHKRVYHNTSGFKSRPTKVEKRPNGVLRIYEELKTMPPVGSLISSKGDRDKHRYAPAFQVKDSSNVTINNVKVHHALGMGFLFERTTDINLLNSGVHLSDGSDRVISTIADASHFANCKGHVLIDNARFENMLDDGVNLRGTYVKVDKIIDENTLILELVHYEQLGYEFAAKNDAVWFIKQPSPARQETGIVKNVRVLNEKYTELTFNDNIPADLKAGDILENKTWYPTFTIRNSTIMDHRARNIVVKTPLKTVIENNYLSSMMASILFRGETFNWFEAGAVGDILIQNNTFEYNSYSAAEQAVMYITPKLGKTFDQTASYDKNIRFINNKISSHGGRIVWADRVDGLLIEGNEITRDIDKPSLYPDAPVFDLVNSKNVIIKNNSYKGEYKQVIKADKQSKKSLINDRSIK